MIVPQQVKCDFRGCEAQRTETNHWFCVQITDAGIWLQTWEQAQDRGTLSDPTAKHFCGAGHALQYISQEMGN